jgi:hypothetical protein
MKNTKTATKTVNKKTTKKGVILKAKKVSPLTQSKKNLVNLWKEETLTPKAIYKFFNSEIAKDLTNKYVTEINISFKSNLTSNALSFKLLSFSYKHEVNSCRLSDDKNSVEYGDKKTHFSPNYMLELLKRKAKYKNPNNEDFKKVKKERELSKLDRLITANARMELNKKALAIGLDFINTTK